MPMGLRIEIEFDGHVLVSLREILDALQVVAIDFLEANIVELAPAAIKVFEGPAGGKFSAQPASLRRKSWVRTKSPNELGRCEEVKTAKLVLSPSKTNRSPLHAALPNFITKFVLRCSDMYPHMPVASPVAASSPDADPRARILKLSVPCMPRDLTAARASAVPIESRCLATISSGLASSAAATPKREVSNKQTTARYGIANVPLVILTQNEGGRHLCAALDSGIKNLWQLRLEQIQLASPVILRPASFAGRRTSVLAGALVDFCRETILRALAGETLEGARFPSYQAVKMGRHLNLTALPPTANRHRRRRRACSSPRPSGRSRRRRRRRLR